MARKGSRIAREPVHQQPHGVDGEDLRPLRAVLSQPRGTAPDAIRQLGGHGANWFELKKLLSIEKKIQSVRRALLFFSVAFCPGFCSVPDSIHSESVQRDKELSGGLVQLLARLLKPLQGGALGSPAAAQRSSCSIEAYSRKSKCQH